MNNLRQLYTGIMLYENDNNGFLPSASESPSAGDQQTCAWWWAFQNTYGLKAAAQDSIYQCPGWVIQYHGQRRRG